MPQLPSPSQGKLHLITALQLVAQLAGTTEQQIEEEGSREVCGAGIRLTSRRGRTGAAGDGRWFPLSQAPLPSSSAIAATPTSAP